MSYEWLRLKAELDGVEPPRRHVCISVNGMGSPGPWDLGFAGTLGSSLDEELFYWHPAAYPAAPFPMGPSVRAGVDEAVRLVRLHAASELWTGKIVLTGYSEGAMVVDHVWRDEFLNPKGRLHDRLHDVIAIVNFGDPMRAPGISHGNDYAGFPVPKKVNGYTTGGICGPGDLTPEQTPPFLMSCNNDGDMYVSAPVGDSPWTQETPVGHDETLIFNVVQDFTAANLLAIATTVIPLLNPAADIAELIAELPALIIGLIGGGSMTSLPPNAGNAQIVGFIEALLGAGMFFIFTGLRAHGEYDKFMPAMVEYVHQTGRAALAA